MIENIVQAIDLLDDAMRVIEAVSTALSFQANATDDALAEMLADQLGEQEARVSEVSMWLERTLEQ